MPAHSFTFRNALSLLFCLVSSLALHAAGPERKVNGNLITSEREPKVRIELPESVHYVGADRFVLYEIADCELHVFVEANNGRIVERLYWVQFEGYLPSKPELHHRYDSPRHATIGGLDFYLDTWVMAEDPKVTSGSDFDHVLAMLRSHGLSLPAGMAVVRLVHLLDEVKRKELMIIYAETLASGGYSAADLREGGKARDQWAKIEKRAVDRATSAIKLRPL
ncbi:MAG TPA: hypothetical protein VH207_00280 [Chthoniobacterales bacterium]|jgi:hypothetical protein|nr:hypothetical protein [Chthoniobacterales bacterium]